MSLQELRDAWLAAVAAGEHPHATRSAYDDAADAILLELGRAANVNIPSHWNTTHERAGYVLRKIAPQINELGQKCDEYRGDEQDFQHASPERRQKEHAMWKAYDEARHAFLLNPPHVIDTDISGHVGPPRETIARARADADSCAVHDKYKRTRQVIAEKRAWCDDHPNDPTDLRYTISRSDAEMFLRDLAMAERLDAGVQVSADEIKPYYERLQHIHSDPQDLWRTGMSLQDYSELYDSISAHYEAARTRELKLSVLEPERAQINPEMLEAIDALQSAMRSDDAGAFDVPTGDDDSLVLNALALKSRLFSTRVRARIQSVVVPGDNIDIVSVEELQAATDDQQVRVEIDTVTASSDTITLYHGDSKIMSATCEPIGRFGEIHVAPDPEEAPHGALYVFSWAPSARSRMAAMPKPHHTTTGEAARSPNPMFISRILAHVAEDLAYEHIYQHEESSGVYSVFGLRDIVYGSDVAPVLV